ncbi:MAG: hypothetical protein KG003_16250 [Bacteroidetes bacterium]|nr:hypothetical protein [Bacteroidota bacterium]
MKGEILDDLAQNMGLKTRLGRSIQILIISLIASGVLELFFGILNFYLFSVDYKIRSYAMLMVMIILAIWQFQSAAHLIRFRKLKTNHYIAEACTKIGASFLLQAVGIAATTGLQLYAYFR